jgi:hypothetical protein
MLQGAISMSTYQRINYRKIYKQYHGPIPKESNGRSYEIHHKDGDHTNNSPDNLLALTLQEHYDIHYAQGDYGACYMMASQRMNRSPDEISHISSLQQRARVADGTHHLLGGTIQRRLVAEGKHHLLSGEIQRKSSLKRAAEGTLPGQGPKNPFWGGEIQRKLVADGKHPLQGPTHNLNRIKNGNHPSQIKKTCPHCGKTTSTNTYAQWHGDNCKVLKGV